MYGDEWNRRLEEGRTSWIYGSFPKFSCKLRKIVSVGTTHRAGKVCLKRIITLLWQRY